MTFLDLSAFGRTTIGALGYRNARRLRPFLDLISRPLFLYLVLIPNFLAIVYFGLVASPVYVSRASLVVLNPASNSSSLTAMLSGGSGDGTSQGAFLLQSFIGSWEEFKKLSYKLDLAHVYRNGDFVSAYGGLATGLRDNDVALWRYYRDHVDVDVEVKSGIASLTVMGYSPDMAQAIARSVLQDSVIHLNAMAERQQQDLVQNAESRKLALDTVLQRDNAALAAYRTRVGTYDPKEQYASNLSLLNSLAARKAELQSQLDSIHAATANSPDARNLGVAIASLQARIGSANLQSAALGRQSAEYDALASRRDNDLTLLQQANVAAQESGQKIAQSRYYLDVISRPSAPQTPELPNRLYWIGGIFVASLLLWSLLR